jgi:valyl-tRNA synthetase
MNLEGFDPKTIKKEDLQLELVDKWIYSRLNSAIKETEDYLQKYTLDEAAKTVYEFIR